MTRLKLTSRRLTYQLVAVGLFPCLWLAGAVAHGQRNLDVLHIGSGGRLSGLDPNREKGAFASLRRYIKDEIGLDNEIQRQADWRVLTDKMAKGELQVGVFQGYEFAWAQAQHPELKPLALAVNVSTYPVACLVVRRDNGVKDFSGLGGQSLSLPMPSPQFLRFYLARQCQAAGKSPETYFSKVATPEDAEEALDDVVDGVVQVTVADRAILDAYRQRKPIRAKRLAEAVRSAPFPPPVVAHYGSALDRSTIQRFRQGLLEASQSDRGQTILTLFRLTGFVKVPDDFDQVLARVRKEYPPASPKAKS